RVVLALCDDQGVGVGALAHHIPGRTAATALAADADSPALTQGVVRQPDVFAHRAPRGADDRAGCMRQVLLQEVAERPLADETDAGAVALGGYRQSSRMRKFPHLLLVQF